MTDLTAVELRELVVAELVPATDTVTVSEAVIVGAGSAGGGGSALTVKEEGTSVDTAVSSINFVGGSQTATQTASGAVTVTSTAYYPGGTDVPVTDGGTGSSTAAGARTNLGLVIGTDVAAQPSGTPTGSKFYRDDGTWASPGGGVTSVDGNTGAVTASQLLTSIKTVDGAGSGLDADLLDGSSSAAFEAAGTAASAVAAHEADTTSVHGIADTSALLTSSSISDTAYDATSWNGVTTVAPSKNAVRDKIETLQAGPLTGDVTTSGAAAMLATVYSGSSSVGSATAVPVLTIDGKGRITATSTATPTVSDPPTVQIIARQILK